MTSVNKLIDAKGHDLWFAGYLTRDAFHIRFASLQLRSYKTILPVLIIILTIPSGHKFARVTTTKLSCNVQISHLLWSYFFTKEQRIHSISINIYILYIHIYICTIWIMINRYWNSSNGVLKTVSHFDMHTYFCYLGIFAVDKIYNTRWIRYKNSISSFNTNTYVHTWAYTRIHAHTCINICARTYTRTYIGTYINIYFNVDALAQRSAFESRRAQFLEYA